MSWNLENLQITSVDLVDQGANPDAHVCLMKRNIKQKAADFVSGLFPDQATPTPIPVIEPTTKKEEPTMLYQEIAKQEEQSAPSQQANPTPELPVEKNMPTEMSPEVQKALKVNAEILKTYEVKIAQLEKFAAMSEFEKVAKKYETLGYESTELADKLFQMKKSGAYDDYVAVLDQSLALLGKSSLFREIGKSGPAPTAFTPDEVVMDVMKRDGCSQEQAFLKAYEENPDFARAYDAGYVQN